MVCHCLLVEADQGLVLVDTGFGLADVERLRGLRSAFRGPARAAYTRFVTRAQLDPAEAAVRHVERLGHSPADVRHVVLTHLDLDHAGGLADFPAARVHVSRAEHEFALRAASEARGVHRFRYWPEHWAHGPDWVTYGAGGDGWHGFGGVRELEGLPGFALVPLPGHSPGHSGVAIRTGAGWLLHAGDAYFDRRETDPEGARPPRSVAAFQKRFEFDGAARRATRGRLRELAAGDDVAVVCSHDAADFERLVHA